LVQQRSASPDDFLFNGELLPAADVDAAEAAIAQAKLDGYERVGNRIKVPRSRKAEFLAAVADAGALPKDFHKVMEAVLDPSPFASSETRKLQEKAAREKQLSMVISHFEGIRNAQVIYDIQEPKGLSRRGKATASVSVEPEPGERVDARRSKHIRQYVAFSIAQMSPDDVMVTDLSDGSMHGGSGGLSPDAFDSPYYQQRLAYEEWMRHQIEGHLQDIPGVRVLVAAELDESLEHTTNTSTPEGDAATIRQVEENGDRETTEIGALGRPGLVAQGPARSNTNDTDVTIKNKDTNTVTETENQYGYKNDMLREAGLVPRDVRASITIPNDYVVELWRERERQQGNDPTGKTPETTILDTIKSDVKQTVQGAVATLFPKEQGVYVYEKVSVQFFESLPVAEIPSPTTAEQTFGWLSQNFNTMTMAFVALVSLVMLRSMVKSIPSSEPVARINTELLAFDQGGAASGGARSEEVGPDVDRPKLRFKKGPNLKEDLTEIVREDPDAAASILRSWIGNAG
jgi:flagellar M-ring protein FliF